jgi:lantibiotic modifying enzyme
MTLAENIVFPLVRYAWERRANVIPGLTLSRKAQNSVRASLCRRLTFPTETIAAYEWQLFCDTPIAYHSTSVGARSDLRNEFFASSVEDRTRSLAEHYPELRRIWVSQIHNWLSFFQRFCLDARKFSRRMNFDGGTIMRLQADVSDLHNGNNAVVRISFRSGGDWFYKPRPAGHNRTWFKLLSRINEWGFPHPFEIPRVVCAGDHHWMEAIRPRRCAGRRQEQDFWFRGGALLYLVHCLHGVDFHAGNLVCRGDQPVFIDCETLGHPETVMPGKVALEERGLFRTGILPLRAARVDSVAALGITTLRRISGKQPRTGCVIPGSAVANGFRSMDSFLKGESRPNGILPWIQRQLSRHQCRVVYRPTAHYYSILLHSFSPRLLREEGSRSAFLVRACRAPHLAWHITRREALALQNLDIPLFMSRASSVVKLPSTTAAERAARIIVRAVPAAAAISV